MTSDEKLLTIDGAKTLYKDLRGRIDSVPSGLEETLAKKVDGAYVTEDGKYLYLTSNGQEVTDALGPFSGGGGGGSGDSAVLYLKNNSKLSDDTIWTSRKITEGASCKIGFKWKLKEDGELTGNVNMVLKVGTTVVATETLIQNPSGEDEYTYYTSKELSDYFTSGKSNYITVTLNDPINALTKSFTWTVTVESISLTSTFNASLPYTDSIEFKYVANGSLAKHMYFYLDDVLIGNEIITLDGVQSSFTIQKSLLTHGARKFESYFTCEIEGQTELVESNHLLYDIIYIDSRSSKPIIASSFNSTSVSQYDTLNISYIVYINGKTSNDVSFYMNDALISTESKLIGEEQVWNPVMMEASTSTTDLKKLEIRTTNGSETVSKIWNIYVAKSSEDLEPYTTDQVLYLNALNRSNDEKEGQREKWQYIKDDQVVVDCTLNDFNWSSNGWLKDTESYSFEEDSKTVSGTYTTSFLRVSDGATVTIPFKPFEQSSSATYFENTGYTIELEYRVTNINNDNTPLIKCYGGTMTESGEPAADSKPGFVITAKQAFMMSNSNRVSSQFKEDEHVRITFVVSPNSTDTSYASNGDRVLYIYVNGIISGAVQYGSGTSTGAFVQEGGALNIEIGSSEARIDIYKIRCHKKDLSRRQVVKNWIGDFQSSVIMLHYFHNNNIYYEQKQTAIDPMKLPSNLPYMVVKAESLATSKTDKKSIEGYYVDPADQGRTDSKEWKSFYFKGAEMVTQGTSSQAYPIKNFKIKFKNGFIRPSSEDFTVSPETWPWLTDTVKDPIDKRTSSKYQMKDDSIKTKTFVFKADFASSEGCNNVELVNFYNELSLYLCPTPVQAKDIAEGATAIHRKGIDGFPMVMFQQKEEGGDIDFIGKYNFNNHKGTEEVYGLDLHGQLYDEDVNEDYQPMDNVSRDEDDNWKATAVVEAGVTDESWEMCDNNNQIGRWKRAAGTGSEDIATYSDRISGFTETYTSGQSYEGYSLSRLTLSEAYRYDNKWYAERVPDTIEYKEEEKLSGVTEKRTDGKQYDGKGTSPVTQTEINQAYYHIEGTTEKWYETKTVTEEETKYSDLVTDFVRLYAEGVKYPVKDSAGMTSYAYYKDGNWYSDIHVTSYTYSDEVTDFKRVYTEGARYDGTCPTDPSITYGYYHESEFYATKEGEGVETDRAVTEYKLYKAGTGRTVEVQYSDFVYDDTAKTTLNAKFKESIELIGKGDCADKILKAYFEDAEEDGLGNVTSQTYGNVEPVTGYVKEWTTPDETTGKALTDDIPGWISSWKLDELDTVSSSLSDLTGDQKIQRTFIIYAAKEYIIYNNNLESVPILAKAWVDMLGTWGGGEAASHAFEVRYPAPWYDAHTEGQPEVVRYKRFVEAQKWVVSTDPDQETGEEFETPITFPSGTFTHDTKEYRLAKFKAEFENYFNKTDAIFYYIWTELFLMIDSRVKNSFPTYFVPTDGTEDKPLYFAYNKSGLIPYYYIQNKTTGIYVDGSKDGKYSSSSDGYYIVVNAEQKAKYEKETGKYPASQYNYIEAKDSQSRYLDFYYYVLDPNSSEAEEIYPDDKRKKDSTGKNIIVTEEGKLDYEGCTFERVRVYNQQTYPDAGYIPVVKNVPRVNEDWEPVLDELGNQIIDTDVPCFEEVETTTGKWQWFPYDMDTAIGIDNEGKLVFDYDLEDTDYIEGTTVYNGQDTTLWNNIRKCFSNDIATQYQNLRAGLYGSLSLSYDEVEKRYESHQSKWPAMVFNDDAYYKYILPLIDSRKENRLEMCQGSKEQQRKWWLSNRFNYIDSKYKAGNYGENNAINFRAYSAGSVKITPYTSMYATVKIGEAFESRARVNAGEEITVDVKNISPNDTESYIFNADQIRHVSGMGSFNPDTVDISKATRMQTFDISGTALVPATKLSNLTIGNNTQLKTFTADYCTGLGAGRFKTLDFSNCSSIESISISNTALTSITLPDGGVVKELYLPNTINNLTIKNQPVVETIEFDNISNVSLSTLDIVYNSITIPDRVLEITDYFLRLMAGSTTASEKKIRLVGFKLTYSTVYDANVFIKMIESLGSVGETSHSKFTGEITITDEIVPYDFIYAVQNGGDYTKGKTTYHYSGYKNMKFICPKGIQKTIKFWNYNQLNTTSGQPEGAYLSVSTTTTGSTSYTGSDASRADLKEDDGYQEVIISGSAIGQVPKIKYQFNKVRWAVAKFDEETETYYTEEVEDILTKLDDSTVIGYFSPVLNVYQVYDELPYKTVYFFGWRNTIDPSEGNLLDRQSVASVEGTAVDVKFTKSFPTHTKGDFIGWGTEAYKSADVTDKDDHKTIVDVAENKKIFSIMGWDVDSITVTTKRDTFFVGEKFDKSVLTVTAYKYNPEGGSSQPIVITSGFDTVPADGEVITASTTSIHVQYTDTTKSGEKPSADVSIYTADSIVKINKLTNNGIFMAETSTQEGDEFDLNPVYNEEEVVVTSTEVEVHYTNGNTGVVTLDQDVFGTTNCYWFLSNYPEEEEEAKQGINHKFISDDVGSQEFNLKLYTLSTTGSVTVLPSRDLEAASWSTINELSLKDTAKNVWKVGDTKSISLVSESTKWQTGTYKFRILGFNHNKNFETFKTGDDTYEVQSSITFGLATDVPASGEEAVEIAFGDSPFAMGSQTVVSCSWFRGCILRKLLNSYPGETEEERSYLINCFYDALPSDLKAVIRTVRKSQADLDVLPDDVKARGAYYWTEKCYMQDDKIFVPSMVELTGNSAVTSHQNSNEKGYEYYDTLGSTSKTSEYPIGDQFDYYKTTSAADKKIRKYYKDYSNTLDWVSRSMYGWVNTDGLLLYVSGIKTDGYPTGDPKDTSKYDKYLLTHGWGIVPCFVV